VIHTRFGLPSFAYLVEIRNISANAYFEELEVWTAVCNIDDSSRGNFVSIGLFVNDKILAKLRKSRDSKLGQDFANSRNSASVISFCICNLLKEVPNGVERAY